MNFGAVLSWRVAVLVFGLTGILWGTAEFSKFRQEATVNRIGRQIIAGDPFKSDILVRQAEVVELVEKPGLCDPWMRRSAGLIRLRLAEVSDNSSLTPMLFRTASTAIRDSLACAPIDPFLWLVLFGIDAPAPLSYLRASYQLGPNEGWIAVKRNPLAFTKFGQLPMDLRDTVVREFLKILEMDFYDDALKIFTGPAWEYRELILSQLDRVPRRNRQNLALRLAAEGYDIQIPGTELNNVVH